MELEKMDSFFDTRAENYDRHMLEEMDLTEFYDEIEKSLSNCSQLNKVLDLGCGTGLELERLFKAADRAEVTAVDLSEQMLLKLKKKFQDRLDRLNLIKGSYMDIDLGSEVYDCVLSTYSLHHFDYDSKLRLYRRIHDSLKQGGCFIDGDYTTKSIDEEKDRIDQGMKLRRENGRESGFYHFDMPFTVDTELRLAKEAGFRKAEATKKWESTTIIIYYK